MLKASAGSFQAGSFLPRVVRERSAPASFPGLGMPILSPLSLYCVPSVKGFVSPDLSVGTAVRLVLGALPRAHSDLVSPLMPSLNPSPSPVS